MKNRALPSLDSHAPETINVIVLAWSLDNAFKDLD